MFFIKLLDSQSLNTERFYQFTHMEKKEKTTTIAYCLKEIYFVFTQDFNNNFYFK